MVIKMVIKMKLIPVIAFVLLCSALTVGAEKKVVRPPGAEPSASWSHGLLVGDTLYISGMGGENAGEVSQRGVQTMRGADE